MTRSQRQAVPASPPPPPWWKSWRGLLYAEAARTLAWCGRLLASHELRLVFVAVGLVVQTVLVMLTYELVDICIQIAELWLELARKHLEITL